MITEQYTSFETARLLKEAGFRELTKTHYSNSGEVWETAMPEDYNDDFNGNSCSRPSQSLAARWIRENHNLHISIEPYANTWRWILWWTNGELITNSATKGERDFETYEQAMEDALRYALTLNTKSNDL